MRFCDSPEREASDPKVERDFARAWQKTPKIVFSTTLREVGPNARLVNSDAENEVASLKLKTEGYISVAGRSCRASRTGKSHRRVPLTCTRSCWAAASHISSPACRWR